MGVETFFLLLALGALVAGAALYKKGVRDGESSAQTGTLVLSASEIQFVHWLATNGFSTLLWIGARKGAGGFKSEEDALAAHHALDRLEAHLNPIKEANRWDHSFDRMGSITLRFKTGPLTPSEQRLRNEILDQ